MAAASAYGQRVSLAERVSRLETQVTAQNNAQANIETLNRIHARMLDLVRHKGGEIEAIFVCPHGPESRCRCRPPLPGLFEQVAERLKINLSGVAAVVATDDELAAARAAGARPMRIGAGNHDADGRTSFVSLQSCSTVLLGGWSPAG